MVDPALLEKVVSLSPEDRRDLFEAVQDSIDPELAVLIDEREAQALSGSTGTRSWAEFRADLREQYGR